MKKKTIYLKRFKAVPKEGTRYSLCYDEYRNECYWSTGPKEGTHYSLCYDEHGNECYWSTGPKEGKEKA